MKQLHKTLRIITEILITILIVIWAFFPQAFDATFGVKDLIMISITYLLIKECKTDGN